MSRWKALNWMRYYDPQLGRYLETDPIGLNGGMNSFTYCGRNESPIRKLTVCYNPD